MNILYISNHLNVGGITSYLLTLASGMKGKGHNVFLASSGGELLGKFSGQRINYIPVPIKTKQEASPKILFCLFKLSKAVRENKIEIIHSNSRTTQVLGCLLSKRTGVPHISTCHGFFKARLPRRIFPCWGKIVIAISQQVKEHLMQDFEVAENRIRVIPNGIDVEKFSHSVTASQRQQSKIGLGLTGGPVIGIVARLSDVKGHVYLIEAMKGILAEFPLAQLLIVGQGKMKNELVEMGRGLGIEKSIMFKDAVGGSSEVLSAMDIFVMPSLKEGLGLALIEAMANGLAVVGSGVGGIKALIQDRVTGLLAKTADANSLQHAIIALLKGPQERQRLGDNARKFIRDNFSQKKMVLATQKAYLECLSAKD